jgi:hypothetical protein
VGRGFVFGLAVWTNGLCLVVTCKVGLYWDVYFVPCIYYGGVLFVYVRFV